MIRTGAAEDGIEGGGAAIPGEVMSGNGVIDGLIDGVGDGDCVGTCTSSPT